jgi:hypothetical protein
MNVENITIALAWGLGNRLRTLVSAAIIAMQGNTPLKVFFRAFVFFSHD